MLHTTISQSIHPVIAAFHHQGTQFAYVWGLDNNPTVIMGYLHINEGKVENDRPGRLGAAQGNPVRLGVTIPVHDKLVQAYMTGNDSNCYHEMFGYQVMLGFQDMLGYQPMPSPGSNWQGMTIPVMVLSCRAGKGKATPRPSPLPSSNPHSGVSTILSLWSFASSEGPLAPIRPWAN